MNTLIKRPLTALKKTVMTLVKKSIAMPSSEKESKCVFPRVSRDLAFHLSSSTMAIRWFFHRVKCDYQRPQKREKPHLKLAQQVSKIKESK